MKLTHDEYSTAVEAIHGYVEGIKKTQPLTEAQIVIAGRALALKKKFEALRDAPKKERKKRVAKTA